MTARPARLLLAAVMLLALAVPAVASAHGGRDRDRGFHKGRACRAVENGRVPRGLTAAQAQALATACTTRANAIAAARTAFTTATASAQADYRTAATPLVQEVSTAERAKRAACRPDRASQGCADARSALRTTIATVTPKLRAAGVAFRAAIAPALRTYRTAVREAEAAFRTSVAQILGRS